MTHNPWRILVGDCSEPMQRWIAMAALRATAPRPAEIVAAGSGTDLLEHLAEGAPFDLVVAQATMPFLGGAQVLAMIRTAGLSTPFVILDYLPTSRLRTLVARAGRVSLVDDPLDGRAIAAASRALLQDSARAPRKAPGGSRSMLKRAKADSPLGGPRVHSS